MKLYLLKGILYFIVLLLAQVLELNHIHLFNYATPLLYVYIALMFRRNYPRWGVLVLCFLMGFCVDMFSNTQGVATASMTFVGLIQPYLLNGFIPRDSVDDFQPSIKTLGVSKFIYYALILVFIYCAVFFTIETFNFFDWGQLVAHVLGSTALTLVIIYAIEYFRNR